MHILQNIGHNCDNLIKLGDDNTSKCNLISEINKKINE